MSSATVNDAVIDAAKDFDAIYAGRSGPAPDDDSTILVAIIDGAVRRQGDLAPVVPGARATGRDRPSRWQPETVSPRVS
ncbi:MAG: hypothetical protein IT175_15785 [Acidobacteria bacterium]|nr:hypothetical protein [Acidobacteriota bacterium]